MTDSKYSEARELIDDLCRIAIDEWNDRTHYGKVLYPLWFLSSVIMWVSVFSFLLIASTIMKLIQSAINGSSNRRVLPDVYKGGDEND